MKHPATMALATLSPAQILGRIRYDPLTKRGSVLDVIQLVTGCSKDHASRNYAGITEKFPDVHQKVADFKFPGQGQRLTPVAHLATLIEIAWLCPGRHAKEFRRTGAVTLCRALGGDLSLIDEIRARRANVTDEEQHALLAGTGVTVAEANGYAVMSEDERKRYRAETEAMMTAAEESRKSTVRFLLELAASAHEDRDRLLYTDSARNYVSTHWGPGQNRMLEEPHDEPVTISDMARELGYRLRRGDESRIGREAARLYREQHGTEPPKHSQFVDGAVRKVNSYTRRHADILERAIREVMVIE